MKTATTKSSSTLERILLAAIDCYGQYGVNETTLEQVAAGAGVSRTTVYRHAKNRRDLLNKVLLRDAQHALVELEVAMRYYQSLEEVVLESILFLMRRRDSYAMQDILYGEADSNSQGLGLSLELLNGLASEVLRPAFEKSEHAGTLPDGLSLAIVADWAARITMSLHSQPSAYTASEAKLRDYLGLVLSPIFHSH